MRHDDQVGFEEGTVIELDGEFSIIDANAHGGSPECRGEVRAVRVGQAASEFLTEGRDTRKRRTGEQGHVMAVLPQ